MLQYLVREKAGDLNARAQDGEFQPYRKRITTEKKAKVVAAVWGGGGQNLFNSMPQLILHQDNLKNKKLMKRGADIWRNGCFGIMDYFALGRM